MEDVNTYNQADLKEMKYDLRQRYANYVGDHLDDVGRTRKKDNYPHWFESIQDLFTATVWKWKDSKREDATKEYNKLLEEVSRVANKHAAVWTGQQNNPEAIAQIKNVLRRLEIFVCGQMEQANMFGNTMERDPARIMGGKSI